MKKILVPCDFSKPAVFAFRIALDIAQQSHGAVHLLNVIELPVYQDPVLMPVLNFEQQFFKELRENAESHFKKLIDEYSTEGVNVITEVQLGGVHSTILDYITAQSVDLVLVGSHGASGLAEYFLGSNAQKIVQRSPVPVLIVKDYFKGPIKSIVFPNTLQTENQEDLVMKVKALQEFFKAKLHIVWINTPVNFTADIVTNLRLDTFAKRYMFKNYSTHVFNHPEEEEGILLFTKFIEGDLIAMGTHSRRGLAHVVNGSLAEDVVNHTDKLVWTYTMKNEAVEA